MTNEVSLHAVSAMEASLKESNDDGVGPLQFRYFTALYLFYRLERHIIQ